MNRRDRELLDKQLHAVYVAPRSDGVLMLAILAVFFAGIAVGGFLYAYTSEPIQFAANDGDAGNLDAAMARRRRASSSKTPRTAIGGNAFGPTAVILPAPW